MANTSCLAQFVGGYESAVTAAGSSIDDAAALTGAINLITSVSAGAGVQLPSCEKVGNIIIARNTDADTVVVYPPDGGSINGGSANAGVNLAQNKTGLFIPCGDDAYMFLLGA